MDALAQHLDQPTIDFVVSFFALFPAGLLLAVVAWIVTIVVHACFRWLKG